MMWRGERMAMGVLLPFRQGVGDAFTSSLPVSGKTRADDE